MLQFSQQFTAAPEKLFAAVLIAGLAGIAFGTGNNGDPRLVATDSGVGKVFGLFGQGARRLTPANAVGAGELIREGGGQIDFDPVAKRLYYRDLIGAVLYANPAAARMLGLPIAEILNANVFRWVHEELALIEAGAARSSAVRHGGSSV
mgnify:CR=1 FL=1